MRNESVTIRFQELFLPSQVGIGERCGAEAVVGACNILAHEHGADEERGLLKVDLMNAFSSVSREDFLQHVQAEYPQLAQWAWFCYGCAGHLWAEMNA